MSKAFDQQCVDSLHVLVKGKGEVHRRRSREVLQM